mmetsp:Transcript_108936/g.347784  ORF Transcript_108936/g.347784 Transcript_108936/m.347784 type:complete len:350 (+) Transcript_108936:3329-4378(+)
MVSADKATSPAPGHIRGPCWCSTTLASPPTSRRSGPRSCWFRNHTNHAWAAWPALKSNQLQPRRSNDCIGLATRAQVPGCCSKNSRMSATSSPSSPASEALLLAAARRMRHRPSLPTLPRPRTPRRRRAERGADLGPWRTTTTGPPHIPTRSNCPPHPATQETHRSSAIAGTHPCHPARRPTKASQGLQPARTLLRNVSAIGECTFALQHLFRVATGLPQTGHLTAVGEDRINLGVGLLGASSMVPCADAAVHQPGTDEVACASNTNDADILRGLPHGNPVRIHLSSGEGHATGNRLVRMRQVAVQLLEGLSADHGPEPRVRPDQEADNVHSALLLEGCRGAEFRGAEV